MNVSSVNLLLWAPPAPLGKFKGQKKTASPRREIAMDLGDLGLLQNWDNDRANNRDVITTSLHLFSETALTSEPMMQF